MMDFICLPWRMLEPKEVPWSSMLLLGPDVGGEEFGRGLLRVISARGGRHGAGIPLGKSISLRLPDDLSPQEFGVREGVL